MRPRPRRTPAKIVLALTVSTSALTAFVITNTSEARPETDIVESLADEKREAAELAELEARLAAEAKAISLAETNSAAAAAAEARAAEIELELERIEAERQLEAERQFMKKKRKSKKYARGY